MHGLSARLAALATRLRLHAAGSKLAFQSRWALAVVLVLTFGLVVALSWPIWPSDEAKPGPALRWRLQDQTALATPVATLTAAELLQDPESQLRQVFAALEAGQRPLALHQAQQLAEQWPHFQLAQLVYADLLNLELPRPVNALDHPDGLALGKRAQELASEAWQRLRHPPLEALRGRVPKGVHLLTGEHRYVAVLDASQSRLYWFENRSNASGPPRLELLRHTYASVGASGMGKNREGDGKTPLGVYFIGRALPGQSLPDLFGVGALTLNYPNAIDVMRNKTGSGIWLHGTPSRQYSRAPQATDGCVVLANGEMQHLLRLPGMSMTPVLLADRLEWMTPSDAGQLPAGFERTFHDWLERRQQGEPEALAGYYSPRFERDELGLDHWWPRLAKQYSQTNRVEPLSPVSILSWHDEEAIVVATLTPPSRPAGQRAGLVRTYWRQEAGQWKIVFEGPA